MLLAAALAMFYYTAASALYKVPIIDKYDGRTVEFSGVITSEPRTAAQTTFFTVRTDTIDGQPARVNISVAANSVPEGGEFDKIFGVAKLAKISDDDGSLGLSYTSYNDARHIFLETYISRYDKTWYRTEKSGSRTLSARFAELRGRIADVFGKYLSYDEAALCTAMITGDKSRLSQSVRGRFGSLGISHLLVVSGLHLSIVAAVLYILTSRLIPDRLAAALIQTAGVIAFAVMTGMGFSVRRALLMYLIMIASHITSSKPDTLNTLGFAAAVLSLDPFSAGDVGLLWSVSCTFALITLSEPIARRLSHTDGKSEEARISPIYGLLSAAMAAFIGSLPFALFMTKQLSPYTIAANILTVPVTGVVVLGGMTGALLMLVGAAPVAMVFLLISGAVAKYLIFITGVLSELPFSGVSIDRPVVVIWAVAAAAVLSVLYAVRFISGANVKPAAVCACLLSAAALTAIIGTQCLLGAERVTLSVRSISGGMTAVLRYDDTAAVLYSCGDKQQYTVVSDELSESTGLSFITDLPAAGKDYRYYRRIVRDNDVGMVITAEQSVSRYSWFEYSGGEVMAIDKAGVLDIIDGGTLEVCTDGALMCEYLTIKGTRVLIADGTGELPKRFCSPDIAVLRDDAHIGELDSSVRVIICGQTDYYDDRITNAEGRRAVIAFGSGEIKIE